VEHKKRDKEMREHYHYVCFIVLFVRCDAPLLIAVVWLLTPCCLVGGYKYLEKFPVSCFTYTFINELLSNE